jgi:6-phosphogluconolactonase (cycloisomerase 2 family)
MDSQNGELVLISVSEEAVMNPAFSRFHPKYNILYTCTESVAENGEILTWRVCRSTGKLTKLSSVDAGGTSTCYVTLDRKAQNALVVNYWDATIGTFALCSKTGEVVSQRSMHDPKEGRPMKARPDKHVNHSLNDASAQKERQSDPHSHAVILEPYFGRIAYVPDLGMDLIRQFRYNEETGILEAVGTIPSGPPGRKALGPRYIEFHPFLPVCYVVNELSSEVSVFAFDEEVARDLIQGTRTTARPTLNLVQTIRTIPPGFTGSKNTCGRIAVHTGGRFLLVSNRGHDSIAVFFVNGDPSTPGFLSLASIQHTRGATPRHFQFDASGQWLIAANQDSDKITIFHFNVATGNLNYTNHEYSVPSPNFVCAFRPHFEEPSAVKAIKSVKTRPRYRAPIAMSAVSKL